MKRAELRYFIFFILLFCLVGKLSNAQRSNVWYFGEYAGLNFNTTPPTSLTDGKLNTFEGCTSISDYNGQILFYTDGTTVYNRLHQIMPNGTGLNGGPSSTCSAIVIPKPGSSTIYYLFTAEPINATLVTSYNFSVVDMQLDGGLGDITSEKNVLLYTGSTERLTAVKQANGIDYWIVTKGFGNNRFSVYKVGCQGIDMNPVVSNVGAVPTSLYDAIGAIKVSPDGKKLCIAINAFPGSPLCQLFDFDNATGIISNPINITGFVPNGLYGVEFSPNSKLLYLGTNRNKVNQYDITSNNQNTINASKYEIITAIGDANLGLQLGPDHKIYVAVFRKTSLSVIDNPDSIGPACNFVIDGIDLNGRKSLFGLPTYISSFFNTQNHVDFTQTLVDCHVEFTGSTDLTGNLQWYWDFGDGFTGTGQIVNHTYNLLGTYTVKLKVIPIGDCVTGDSFLISHPVVVEKNNSNQINLNYTFNNCQVQFTGVTNAVNSLNWLWDFGDGTSGTGQTANHIYQQTGTYTVTLTTVPTEANCIIYDTLTYTKSINIKDTISKVDFTNTLANCQMQFTGATNSTSSLQWIWDFGDNNSGSGQIVNHSYQQSGTYPVMLTAVPANNCVIKDSLFSFHFVPLHLNNVTVYAGADTTIFYNLPFQLNATGTPATGNYVWSPAADLNNPFIVNPVALLKKDALYTVTITDENGCTASDNIFIKVFGNPEVYVPNSFTPNGDGKNDVLKPLGFGLKKILYFKIFNRYGQLVFETNNLGTGWDGIFKGKAQPSGTYTYMVKVINYRDWPVEQKGTVILIR
jgi:gliding motility-associated-like protein